MHSFPLKRIEYIVLNLWDSAVWCPSSLQDMEEFVQSSGDDGVVVFTLGSMLKNVSHDRANMIASGLAQIPQKVGLILKMYTCMIRTRIFNYAFVGVPVLICRFVLFLNDNFLHFFFFLVELK